MGVVSFANDTTPNQPPAEPEVLAVNDPIADAISSTTTTEATSSSTTDPLADALANPTSTSSSEDPLANALSEGPNNNYIPPMRLSGPNALPEGIAITSLDFDQQKDSSQVVIGLQNVTKYTDNKPRPDTITIDVDNAFVPKSLSRVLDTSKFYSPVKMIRVYRT